MDRVSGLRLGRRMATAIAAAALAGAAQAGAIITFGQTSLGINDTAELNFGGVGVLRSGVGDAIIPGCPCEGWGVALTSGGDTFATFANQAAGSGGFSLAPNANSFGFTASTATSVVTMADLPVTVRHAFGPSLAADVFQVQVTVTNQGTSALDDLVYRRAMDWDVPPTVFNEYVTHRGVVANLLGNGGNVKYAGNDGFASSDPRVDPFGSTSRFLPTFANPAGSVDTTNTDFEKAGPSDHGSVFDFAFGRLGAGESRTFNIFYGSAANAAEATAKVTQLGVNLYSLGQSSGPAGSGGGDGGVETLVPPGGELMLAAAAPDSFDPDAQPTFLFAFGGVGGVALGSSQDNPILPFQVAPTTYYFDAPAPRQWFDPPFASGFAISLTGGSMISITAPSGFEDMKIVATDGTVLDADFDAGETYAFADGVSSFRITGIHVDLAKAAPFPLFMDFERSVTGMTWTAELAPVPEAGTLASMLAGLGLLTTLFARRRRGV